MGYIYILTSPSGKSYVGQTTRDIEERFGEHQEPTSACRAIRNAIQYYGWDRFIADYYECPDGELNKNEKWMVELLGTLSPGGYNLREGGGNRGKHSEESKQKNRDSHIGKILTEEHKQKIGEALVGGIRTEETRQRMREASLGKTLTEETRQRISEAKLGIPLSEETRQKISEALLGRTFTEGHKQKIGEAQRGDKHHSSKRVYQYDLEGNLLGTFGSSGEAARCLEKKYGNKIRECALGKSKTAYGFRWSRDPPLP